MDQDTSDQLIGVNLQLVPGRSALQLQILVDADNRAGFALVPVSLPLKEEGVDSFGQRRVFAEPFLGGIDLLSV